MRSLRASPTLLQNTRKIFIEKQRVKHDLTTGGETGCQIGSIKQLRLNKLQRMLIPGVAFGKFAELQSVQADILFEITNRFKCFYG
jgi:hypothetical protein